MEYEKECKKEQEKYFGEFEQNMSNIANKI